MSPLLLSSEKCQSERMNSLDRKTTPNHSLFEFLEHIQEPFSKKRDFSLKMDTNGTSRGEQTRCAENLSFQKSFSRKFKNNQDGGNVRCVINDAEREKKIVARDFSWPINKTHKSFWRRREGKNEGWGRR